MPDSLFRGTLEELDPDVYELTQLESERQYRKLILIASESTSPLAVRDALDSAFQNVYAEGYPDEDTRWMTEEEILDYDNRLAHYRKKKSWIMTTALHITAVIPTRVITRASSMLTRSRR